MLHADIERAIRCVPCMKTMSVNNCLDYGVCRVFVNYYLCSTVCKMLPDFLLEPSVNVRFIDDTMNRPTVQEEVPPPKIVICNLIFFNIFLNIKTFLSKSGWNRSPTFSAAFKEKSLDLSLLD